MRIMAILNKKDIIKMSSKERKEKIKDLKMELIKEKINLSKGGKVRMKEIKKTIARLLTYNKFNRLNKPVETK